ncbi:MAG: tetratricopeptide repeat protein, partial [Sphingomonadales bacterium]
FVNMSSDPEQEYFSDGISEELLNALVKLPGLKVAARTSSFSFKGRNMPVQEIGKILGVEHLLEGSVRTAGLRIRVTAQLIRVEDGFHLWSETYDRNLDDIFAVQDEITGKIIDELRLKLSGAAPTAKAATANTEAYQAYLKGRYFWNLRTAASLLTSIEHLEEATRLDPEYAGAWAGLADAYNVIPSYDINHDKAKERLEKGRQAALRALEIDPGMGRAYIALGSVSDSLFQWKEAGKYYERGLELAPEYATGWQWYGSLLADLGRYDEALAAYEKALELDPVSRIIHNNYAEALRGAGRTSEAIKHFEYAITLHPDFGFNYFGLAMTHLEAGNHAESRAALRADPSLAGEELNLLLAWIDRVEAFATTGEAVDAPTGLMDYPGYSHREPAQFLILSGHVEAGLDLLEEAFDLGHTDAGLYWVFYDNGFKSVWDHPRFRALRVRAGLEEAAE